MWRPFPPTRFCTIMYVVSTALQLCSSPAGISPPDTKYFPPLFSKDTNAGEKTTLSCHFQPPLLLSSFHSLRRRSSRSPAACFSILPVLQPRSPTHHRLLSLSLSELIPSVPPASKFSRMIEFLCGSCPLGVGRDSADSCWCQCEPAICVAM